MLVIHVADASNFCNSSDRNAGPFFVSFDTLSELAYLSAYALLGYEEASECPRYFIHVRTSRPGYLSY